MKSKPIIISIIILAIAAILIISTNRNDNDDDSTSASQTGKSTTSNAPHREPRTRHGSSSETSTGKWEEQIDDLLGEDSTSHDKATRGLLRITLDSKAPMPIRNDALEHALNLVEDEDFRLIQSIIGTGRNEIPEQLVQTILDDTLNRPEPIQLTTALKVLEGSHTSVIEEATDLLEFHLEEEYGTDIKKWTKAVDAYIAAEKKEG